MELIFSFLIYLIFSGQPVFLYQNWLKAGGRNLRILMA
jgi:hypothetical protein